MARWRETFGAESSSACRTTQSSRARVRSDHVRAVPPPATHPAAVRGAGQHAVAEGDPVGPRLQETVLHPHREEGLQGGQPAGHQEVGVLPLGHTPSVLRPSGSSSRSSRTIPQRGLGAGQGRGGHQPSDTGSDHDSSVRQLLLPCSAPEPASPGSHLVRCRLIEAVHGVRQLDQIDGDAELLRWIGRAVALARLHGADHR